MSCVCETYHREPSARDLQYQLLRNELHEDDFLCMVARLPEHSPRLAEELRDKVKRALINTVPERGAIHSMTADIMKRIEFGKKLFE